MNINDELIKVFANRKIEDAYIEFKKKHGYDPRYSNGSIRYCYYDIEEESEEEEDEYMFNEPSESIYVIKLTYGEVTGHDIPYSITTSYFLDDVKKEIRDIQIENIL